MPAIRDAISSSELDRFLRNVSREVRLSGTPEEARAFDFIQAELESFGYQVSRYASDALIGYPERSSLEIVGDPSVKLTANGYSLSPRTSDEGITGDLLYASD